MSRPNPFDELVTPYDAWFESDDGRIVFEREMGCLLAVMPPRAGRWLEVGVGTGRFAAALGVTDGVDPSARMRALAERRGVRTVDAACECLPYGDRSFEGALMTTTLCFLVDPPKSFHECHRVLKDAGHLVIGMIPANSQWGKLYARKASEGHPIYSAATFHTTEEVICLASAARFELREACSCLLAPPESLGNAEQRQKGIVPDAGFVAMAFAKAGLENRLL